MDSCRLIFKNKTADYGTAWRVLRLPSLTDQVLIKAQRIANLQQMTVAEQQLPENQADEFKAIVNYCIMALIQSELGVASSQQTELSEPLKQYDKQAAVAQHLMQQKNHDYGEIWRSMRVSSMTDIILMKLLRIKQIEENKGATKVSEGVEANYLDILNYAVFCLILLAEKELAE